MSLVDNVMYEVVGKVNQSKFVFKGQKKQSFKIIGKSNSIFTFIFILLSKIRQIN